MVNPLAGSSIASPRSPLEILSPQAPTPLDPKRVDKKERHPTEREAKAAPIDFLTRGEKKQVLERFEPLDRKSVV